MAAVLFLDRYKPAIRRRHTWLLVVVSFLSLCSMTLKKDLWVCADGGGLGGGRGYDRIRMRFFIEDGSRIHERSLRFLSLIMRVLRLVQEFDLRSRDRFQKVWTNLKIIGLTDAEGFFYFSESSLILYEIIEIPLRMTSEGVNYFWFTLEFQEVGKQTSEQLTFC
jgi:hypothetical protein